MSEERLYFAFGSNIHPQRIQERVGRAKFVSVARLPSASLTFNKIGRDGSGKCNVEFTSDARCEVFGALYRLTRGQKSELDEWESLGKGYIDMPIEVATPQGAVSAVCYRASAEFVDDSLLPFPWYRDLVLLGATHLALPEPYIRVLREQATTTDSDLRVGSQPETHRY